MEPVEKVILRNLLKNDEFTRKVLPFLKTEYFSGSDQKLYDTIQKFILKYNVAPTLDALILEVDSNKTVTEPEMNVISDVLQEFSENKTETTLDWLVNRTEQFCQDQAIVNALSASLDIIQNNSKVGASKGTIPQLLSNALAITFDPNVGHDYLEQYQSRYDYYHKVLDRIPFDLEYFNKITNGGLPAKTLNIVMGSTGTGKSLVMCHMAASALSMGRNVLYITLELSEEEVGKRIDANLLNTEFVDLMALSNDMYEKKVRALQSKTNGKLIIKEYPTASASVLHFKALLNELNLKKNFKPDIIFIDYINICSSARIKMGTGVNSYSYIKSIAEEIRGLAVEFNVPVMSATQTNRSGSNNSDIDLDNVSDSFGLPMTADMMFVLIATEELTALGQIMIKQLKNRYGDENENKRFVIGVDKKKMKLYDVEASAQKNIANSGQTATVPVAKPNTQKNKFGGLKVT